MRVFKQKYRGKAYRRWTVEFTDHLGTRRKIQAFADKGASAALGHKLEKLVSYRTARRALDAELTTWLEGLPAWRMKRLADIGLIDGETSAATKALMVATRERRKQSSHDAFNVTGGHLADFRRHMEARELNPQHIGQVISHCARLIDARRWAFPSDVSTDGIENYIASLRESGASARTANAALAAFKSFCAWLKKQGRMATNPADRVSKLNERADRRLIRRALTTDECRRLVTVTETEGDHHGMTGHERALVYRLALTTGLRHGEIRKLRRIDFALSADPSSVTITAESEKAGRGDTLPLRPDLARDLEAYFSERLAVPMAAAFPNLSTKGAAMLRADLDAAGIDWREDEAGETLDFHSLRHTFGSQLAASGVHPKTAMDLMRHSDVNLTLGLYSHTLIGDRAKATATLPDFDRPAESVKTGTDHTPASDGRGNKAHSKSPIVPNGHDLTTSAANLQKVSGATKSLTTCWL
jgi:integrase